MERTITSSDLTEHLADILARIRERGECFIIERDGEPLASLTPIGVRAGPTMRELADRLGDLTLPGDGFADDLELAQRAQSPVAVTWPRISTATVGAAR